MSLRSLLGLLALAAPAFAAAPLFNGVGLRVSDEVVPPGGVAQIKISLTEPKPIPTGRFELEMESWAMADVLGVAVSSGLGDASCVFTRRGTAMTIRCSSPKGSLGLTPDYPTITIAVRVSPAAPLGARSIVRLNSTSFFTDLTGLPYPTELKDGSITIENTANIHNIRPGGGPLASGQPFEILGEGFTPLMRVQVDEVPLLGYQVLSSTRIVAVPAIATDLSGREIRVRSGKIRPAYFSYLRAESLGDSRVPLVRASEPMFPATLSRLATLPGVQADPSKPLKFSAVAVQNPHPVPAVVVFELRNAAGAVAATRVLVVPAYHKLFNEVHELFGAVAAEPGRSVRFRCARAIQMFGAHGDSSTGELLPAALQP